MPTLQKFDHNTLHFGQYFYTVDQDGNKNMYVYFKKQPDAEGDCTILICNVKTEKFSMVTENWFNVHHDIRRMSKSIYD